MVRTVNDAVVWVAGAVALVAGTVPYVPQWARLLRTGDVTGLSATALLNGSVNYTLWTLYLAMGRAWGVLGVNVAASVIWYGLTVTAARSGLTFRRAFGWSAVWAVAVAASAVVGYEAFGVALTVGAVVAFCPMAVQAWTAPSTTGLSVWTWWLSLADGCAYLVLGVAAHSLGIVGYGVVAVAAAVGMLAAIGVRRDARSGLGRRAPRAATSLAD